MLFINITFACILAIRFYSLSISIRHEKALIAKVQYNMVNAILRCYPLPMLYFISPRSLKLITKTQHLIAPHK